MDISLDIDIYQLYPEIYLYIDPIDSWYLWIIQWSVDKPKTEVKGGCILEDRGSRGIAGGRGCMDDFAYLWLLNIPGLVNVYITMERSTIFNGKTHYFYGHFQ